MLLLDKIAHANKQEKSENRKWRDQIAADIGIPVNQRGKRGRTGGGDGEHDISGRERKKKYFHKCSPGGISVSPIIQDALYQIYEYFTL